MANTRKPNRAPEKYFISQMISSATKKINKRAGISDDELKERASRLRKEALVFCRTEEDKQ